MLNCAVGPSARLTCSSLDLPGCIVGRLPRLSTFSPHRCRRGFREREGARVARDRSATLAVGLVEGESVSCGGASAASRPKVLAAHALDVGLGLGFPHVRRPRLHVHVRHRSPKFGVGTLHVSPSGGLTDASTQRRGDGTQLGPCSATASTCCVDLFARSCICWGTRARQAPGCSARRWPHPAAPSPAAPARPTPASSDPSLPTPSIAVAGGVRPPVRRRPGDEWMQRGALAGPGRSGSGGYTLRW